MFTDLFKRSAEDNAFAEKWNAKYPFLHVKDNRVCPWHSFDHCWLEDIPSGWVDAFGEQMCEELMEALGDYVDDFIIIQLKEKYGEMRLYYSWSDDIFFNEENAEQISIMQDKISNILAKYAELSSCTCIECGEEANYSSTGWICPYCEEHAPPGSIKIRSK